MAAESPSDDSLGGAVADVLASVDEWPVDAVAAAALSGDATSLHGPTDRPFPLASVSKLLTAYAVMLAVEEGAVELDGAVAADDGAIEIADAERPPSVRELLAHAGGVAFGERTQQREPQTRRIYSSAGYEILADHVADATEMPFSDYCEMGLNEPLGINVDFSGSAGHGFSASLVDLVTFARELLHPALLHESTVAEMFHAQYPELDGVVPGYGMQKPCPWGLGFELRGDKGASGPESHWMAASMPRDVAGHFGQSGTFMWIAQNGSLNGKTAEHSGVTGQAAIVLCDRAFGDWAKPLWGSFNAQLWEAMS